MLEYKKYTEDKAKYFDLPEEKINEIVKTKTGIDFNSEVKVSLHNHPGGSVNDAVDEPSKYVRKAKEKGYEYFTVTEHGSFTSMFQCLKAAKKENIHIIYGTEAYVTCPPYDAQTAVAHMIMLAKNKQGKRIIDKLVSKSEAMHAGKPAIKFEDLLATEFNNSVVITTACIQGLPSLQLRRYCNLNKVYNANKDNYDPSISEKVSSLNDSIKQMDVLVEELKVKENTLKEEYRKLNTDISNDLRNAKAKKDENEIKLLKASKEDLKVSKDKRLGENKDAIKEANLNKKKFKAELDELEKKYSKNESIKVSIEKQHVLFSEKEAFEAATRIITLVRDRVGKDNFFIEIQNHGMVEEETLYTALVKIAKDNEIPLIAANDSHLPDNSVSAITKRSVARYLRFERISDEPWDKELYIKSPNELAYALLQIFDAETVKEAMLNLNKIKIEFTPEREGHYPVFDKTKDSKMLLKKAVIEGIKEKYPGLSGWTKAHKERVEYELNIINEMGYNDYFLIVKDFIEYGRIIGLVPDELLDEVPLTIEEAKKYVKEHNFKIGQGTGVGRGSGAGSLVVYLLGITGLDPLKYNLLFERFLNVERVSMPDLDCDFSPNVRNKVILYVKNKYGNDAVAGIITKSYLKPKSSIKDAARYYGELVGSPGAYYALADEICKKITDNFWAFDSEIDDNKTTLIDSLRSDFSANENAIKILDIAYNIEGMLRQYGQHAAGIIIYDDNDITNYTSTTIVSNKRVVETDKIESEENGLLKMDFLGLNNLSIMTDAIRMISERYGEDIDIEKDFPVEGTDRFGHSAEEVYENIYAKGRTKNVFQFESAGMRKYLKELS